ncbi:sodium-translocating pyrophosphatase [bacterium]|nr:sodium-translocating pyrophosphatase [bacterium]
MNAVTWIDIIPAIGTIALIYAFIKATWVEKQDPGNEKMQKIAGHIREGAMTFLYREYKCLLIFVVVVALLLVLGNKGWFKLVAVSFVVGAVCSALSGFFGMRIATLANVRTANAARTSINKALSVAFSGGTVMGMCVVGFAIVGLGSLLWIYTAKFGTSINVLRTLVLPILSGFSLGASSIALFARVGGGIFTKAADIGADLVGKVEAGIPEDDPRNPAVIADNVGDNVGDVAGMGADLFESYVGSIIGAMILGAVVSVNLVILPLLLALVGIVVSILGTFFVRTNEDSDPQRALNIGTFGAAIVMILFSFFIIQDFVPKNLSITPNGVFLAIIVGVVAGALIGIVTEYYTAVSKKPVQMIAKESETGSATNIIAGLSVGMRSTWLPIIILGAGIVLAHNVAGLYGIAMAALGMLSTTGIQLAVDAYGPIADNAGGITEMSGLGEEVRKRTDKLDAVGNTTAAIGKGFAIGSAALTALALFSAFKTTAGIKEISISDPKVMAGLIIGGMIPYLFSSFLLKAVGQAAFEMIREVRRQFKEIPGLIEGKAEADFKKCIDISTKAALKQMILPGVGAVIIPVVAGFLDKELLGGLLAGVLVSGVLLAIFMANAGGAWDNAKKYIESGAFGGKGSAAHKAAVVGDTVGDPFKDTAGPSLNILIKLMSVVALVIAPLL